MQFTIDNTNYKFIPCNIVSNDSIVKYKKHLIMIFMKNMKQVQMYQEN